MIPTPADPFEEWLRLPLQVESSDPRFDVRRAKPAEFERIYDVVDLAFGKKRSRAQFDWLYRDNPFGKARCWIVIERESGEILKSGAGFPWPIWRGREPLLGSLAGDAATLPHWQRKGLTAIRRSFYNAHPWCDDFCGIGGPNESSRIVSRKAGDKHLLLGALVGGLVPLRSRGLLERAGVPAVVARPAGATADALFSAWRGWASNTAEGAAGRVEEVDRFTVDFDEVTERSMAWSGFWSPHNAEFLNWRYLDHPVEAYVGLAFVEEERPTGYAVVCLEEEKATLAEFAVPSDPPDRSLKLLSKAIAVARDAGCASLNFFGTPTWHHWPLFRRAGFIPYQTKNHLSGFGRRHEPEVLDSRNWQVTPGDRDFR